MQTIVAIVIPVTLSACVVIIVIGFAIVKLLCNIKLQLINCIHEQQQDCPIEEELNNTPPPRPPMISAVSIDRYGFIDTIHIIYIIYSVDSLHSLRYVTQCTGTMSLSMYSLSNQG